MFFIKLLLKLKVYTYYFKKIINIFIYIFFTLFFQMIEYLSAQKTIWHIIKNCIYFIFLVFFQIFLFYHCFFKLKR